MAVRERADVDTGWQRPDDLRRSRTPLCCDALVTILHISDLHRSPSDPVRNGELLAALDGDRRRWPNEVGRNPDVVIVNGDLVQGVAIDSADYEQALDDQYAVAFELLAQIADQFLDGDRGRMVIVPGNHDVDWNCARAAMEPASVEDMRLVASELPQITLRSDSPYRWSWRERVLYKVQDVARYQERLTPFLERRREFYGGVSPNPLRLDDDLLFLEFPALGISITGLSSWFGCDCYCRVGSIDPDVLAKAQTAISKSSCDAHIAVWHHSTTGLPDDDAYIDVRSIYRLIDYGYRIGLHGHNHRTAATIFQLQLRLPTAEEMAVVSVGSIAAGGRALPAGVHRQYNVMSLDVPKRSVRVFVRESVSDLIFTSSPRAEFGGNDYLDLTWSASSGAETAAPYVAAVDDAYKAFAEKDYERVLQLLEPIVDEDAVVRKLRIDALLEVGRHSDIVALVEEPRSADELMVLVGTAVTLGPESAPVEVRRHCERLGVGPDLERELIARLDSTAIGHD